MSGAGQSTGMTMLDKIWSKHSILERADGETLLYVDRHLVHDGYAPAFEFLKARGLRPHSPHQIFATPDHYVPTDGREVAQYRRRPARDGQVAGRECARARHHAVQSQRPAARASCTSSAPSKGSASPA